MKTSKFLVLQLVAFCTLIWLVYASVRANELENTYVYLPIIVKPALPSGGVINGDFEAGRTAWAEYSSNGYQLILPSDQLAGLPLHSGSWAAWLGGDYYEDSMLSQVFTVPANAQVLRYWLWIASSDYCNVDYDIAGVFLNGDVVDAFYLCSPMNTGGWAYRTVNVTGYAGQPVTLDIAAFTDGLFNSNLFIDDVFTHSTLIVPQGESTGMAQVGNSEIKPDLLQAAPVTSIAFGERRSMVEHFLLEDK